jgi:hypothetical protein
MVDTKPLLKGFGAAVDVAGQIATDKAVNSRRVRSDFSQFDITNGQLVEDATADALGKVPHSLNRVPKGALILMSDPAALLTNVTREDLTFDTPGAVVTVWVV